MSEARHSLLYIGSNFILGTILYVFVSVCLFTHERKQCYLARLEHTRNRSGFHFRLLTVLIKQASQGASAEKNGSFTSWQPFYKRRFFFCFVFFDSVFYVLVYLERQEREKKKKTFYFFKISFAFFS